MLSSKAFKALGYIAPCKYIAVFSGQDYRYLNIVEMETTYGSVMI
jgi:hypothetical protein